ncbi:MAG: c-type cytochrome [Opitutaceae bacterium]
MVRFIKVLLGFVVVCAILVAAGAGLVYWRSSAKLLRIYSVAVSPPDVPTDPAAIARGRHIAAIRGCVDCHGADMGGGEVMDNSAMGLVYAPNLTRGRGGLPPSFSDEDFVRAIRHGIGLGGRPLFFMPSEDYARFTTEDMGDVIAFVKALPPVDRTNLPMRIGPVARMLLATGKMRLAAEEIDHATLRPSQVTPGPTAAYGRYLSATCTSCHGSNFSGGKIPIGPPDWPPAANLTPAGQLNGWTEADFIRTVRTGHRPDGTELSPVMPRAFGEMSNTELQALWAFLRTLPPAPTGVHPESAS